jgi:branched-chain amino acid transport system ATP-binding protein
MRGVAGAMLPRKGRIVFDGKDVTRLPAHARVAAGIALVPEGRRVFPALSVRENLEMGGFKYRKDRRKVDELIERAMHAFPRLRERGAQAAGTLSGGEQQMLALSRALMSEPRLLCMDEPSLGLAPIIVQEIFRSIRAVNASGTSVLLVEQNARYALETASRGYVLQTGAIIAAGPCAELKQDERVKEAYLGRR